MEKITKNLFESILTVTQGKVEEGSVDKAHFCATHVEHSLYGQGTCISEQHAEPDENGKIDWYTVQFPTGVLRVNTDNLKIVEGKSHAHSKKMAEEEVKDEEVVEAKLHPNQQKLDVHEPEKDKLTAKDFEMLRAGKKAKMKNEASDPENILPKDAAAPVSKSPNDKEKKSAMANQVSTQKQGKGGMDAAKVSSVKEASTGNAFDWKNTPSQLKTKPGEKAGFDSKKIPTGTVYTRKPPKPVKENITQTIINHDDFVLEVTDNPTYGDYLKALQSMINTTSEDVQQELINVAEEAFNNKVDSIIIESKTRATFKAKLDELRKSGAKVLDENYMVDSGEPYVEYVVEKDGVLTQHVHVGTVKKS
jgi:hypothetical protein